VNIIRVFPRRTNATPDDDYAFYGEPPLFRPEANEVHVSCTFTYDRPLTEKLAKSWGRFYPVKIGGPAFGDRGDEFIPGLYLKRGYVITSRGCDQKCWFCFAWKREGEIRELIINDGYNILDNNLLACSTEHCVRVFQMLARQKKRAVFSGGLDPKKIGRWAADHLTELNPLRVYLAYDTEDDKEPLAEAVKTLRKYGEWPYYQLSTYVLVGYPRDTFERATERLEFCLSLGIFPYAMLYRDDSGKTELTWRRFQRGWIRPKIVATKLKQYQDKPMTSHRANEEGK